MAKADFLKNFKQARSLFVHPQVDVEGSQLDPKVLETKLARSALWLTKRAVEGFDARDFESLGPAKTAELVSAIQEFREVADQVGPAGTATAEQLSRAKAAFSTALSLLTPQVPLAPDERAVEDVMKSIQYPEWVVNWDQKLDIDWTDEPVVYVNLYMDDQTTPRNELGRFISDASLQLIRALGDAGVGRRPYVTMQSAGEYKSR